MECALSCLRAFFIVLSICYVVFGLAGSIASGVFIYVFRSTSQIKDLFTLAGEKATFDHVVIALIVITVAFVMMMVSGFVGCCAMGRRHHNQCCQDTLASFALIITLMFTSAVILLAVYRNELKGTITRSFEVNMQAYSNVHGAVVGPAAESAVNGYVDSTQQSSKCCGSSGYQSWRTLRTSWAAENPDQLAPTSCCFRPDEVGCNKQSSTIYQRGCAPVISDISSDVFTVIYIVGAVIAAVSLIEMLTACYMARTSNKGGGRGCCCCD